ncbi:MAG: hypothetical protein FJ319_07525 [SAR202 cluster bacterium]|nr:hypothetical protein [SAR202 cluster bacterium]
MTGERKKKRIVEGFEIIVDESRSAIKNAYEKANIDKVGDTIKEAGENLRDAVQDTLSARDTVVMVRLNREAILRLEELVDAGVVNSRSEGAAFLIGEGIKARGELFRKISEKVDRIRAMKQELRDILNDDQGSGPIVTPPPTPGP